MAHMNNEPNVIILLLGDADVGKTCFISRLTLGAQANQDEQLPAYQSRVSLATSGNQDNELPPYELPRLKDMDQPFTFNMHIRGVRNRFHFYDTSSPENYTLVRPNMVVLCYDISNRRSLESLSTRWKRELDTHFNYDEVLPIVVLGLKRDLRREWTREERQQLKGATIMPQEGLLIAQQLRCDVYAECSALTGELFREAVEDIAKVASKTMGESGGKSEGGCTAM